MTERVRLSTTRRVCMIDGCQDHVVSRGWCDRHYRRWKRYGNPETLVKTPEGEPRRFYETTVLGFAGTDCLAWPYNRNSGGYGMVYDPTTRKHLFIHRLACAHANGPAPSPEHQAAHSCGNGRKGCVNPNHLSWKTAKENHADKIAHGTHRRGEANYAAKLTADDVRAIRRLAGSISQSKIGLLFGVAQRTVGDIIHRKHWAWLND